MIGRIAALILATSSLTACTIVSLDEDREVRERTGSSFDAKRYVASIWSDRVMSALNARAIPVATLVSDPSATRRMGRRAGEGSPLTISVRGEGIVTAIDNTSPQGGVTLSVVAPGSPVPVRLQTGPVVTSTAIRDALPFVNFDDFADQIAFAEVGNALTERALTDVRPALRTLRPGTRLRFLAVGAVPAPAAPLVMVPVRAEVVR